MNVVYLSHLQCNDIYQKQTAVWKEEIIKPVMQHMDIGALCRQKKK